MNTRNLRFRSNRVRDIATLYHEELDVLYGRGEVDAFLVMLFEAFLGWDRVRLMTSREQTVDQSDLLRFHWALEDLKKQRPIQHIIGYTDFCGCRIKVSPDVLIPRPETAEMVEEVIGKRVRVKSVLDLCTGSGCIAIALKRAFPEAEVTAVEVSEKALAIARENAKANGTDITFLQADILSSTSHLPLFTYHLIVSNPPYVRDSERAQMRRNVLDYDPALALFVPDDDPLRFYRAIAAIAKEHLAQDGMLVLEINEALTTETCALLKTAGFIPAVFQDFRGKDRWIAATSSLHGPVA
ncbi:MAG: peptide chain release factor N(5)-glutamine methyltransferase [Bacteroidales bacterium]|nr:peptide chain release factor N(5)-glutamine methyltransferase [Bacteroidales bacterium]